MQRSNPLLDDWAARWEFWTVCTCFNGIERDRASPKFFVYKSVVCKLSDFSNLFAKSMHVDWPFDVCARILPVLVFVTVHFMYGKQSSSIPFFLCMERTHSFTRLSFPVSFQFLKEWYGKCDASWRKKNTFVCMRFKHRYTVDRVAFLTS
jgi:hypothetical protein